MTGLAILPVELYYELQLFALSEAFPMTSRHIYGVFLSAPVSLKADYLLNRAVSTGARQLSSILTKALRYPLCTKEVLDLLYQRIPSPYRDKYTKRIDIPRRLFRSLNLKSGPTKWKEQEDLLSFLRHLFDLPMIPHPNVNAHDGYALTKAVQANLVPLIRFLLDKGADPQCNDYLAIMIAIRHKELALVKMLIERDDSPCQAGGGKGRKRRRLDDRVEVRPSMLRVAVRCEARNISEYLMWEKGCVPDMQTLHMMK